MRCEDCFEFCVSCPCCDESFCPGCGALESELEAREAELEEDD